MRTVVLPVPCQQERTNSWQAEISVPCQRSNANKANEKATSGKLPLVPPPPCKNAELHWYHLINLVTCRLCNQTKPKHPPTPPA
jgi:hypothetical protein